MTITTNSALTSIPAKMRRRPLHLGRTRWTISSALLLAACATAPPETASVLDQVAVPPRWDAAETEEPAAANPPELDRWWRRFGDPELDRLVDAAFEHNHDLRAAAAAVAAAEARARIAGAELEPRIGVGVDAARRQQVFVGLPIPGSGGVLKSRSTSYGASLDVSWEADLWGRLRSGEAAATSDLAASRADYRGARLSLAGQVTKVWLARLEAERQLALAARTVASRRTTTERIDARYRRGLAPPVELRLARTSEAQAASDLELRRRQLDAADRQLQILLGRYPSRTADADAGLPPVPSPVPAGLPAELVRRRPDLLAAERRLAAAGWRVEEARRALYPRLTLTGSGGTSSDQLGDLLDGDFTVWSLAGGLLQPLFQGGRLRAAVELAEADRERALRGYLGAVLAAFSEVETALAAESFLAAEEAALAGAADEARAAARLAEDRYLAGVGDYLQLLESQRQSFATESRLLAVRARRLTNRVDLHLALGGGLDGDLAATPETRAGDLPSTPQPPPPPEETHR